jgi:hypothetical protein
MGRQFLSRGSAARRARATSGRDRGGRGAAFAGGWSSVDGLDLTPDRLWLAAGIRRLEALRGGGRTTSASRKPGRHASAATRAAAGRHACPLFPA